MLNEIKNVRQIEGEGLRRWFTDKDMDLILWYNKQKQIEGFQLCYDKQSSEKALTWRIGDKYSHDKIDHGKNPWLSKETPILTETGKLNKSVILKSFIEANKNIEESICSLILEKIDKYK